MTLRQRLEIAGLALLLVIVLPAWLLALPFLLIALAVFVVLLIGLDGFLRLAGVSV